MSSIPSSDRSFDGTRPADVVFKDFVDTFNEIIKQSGTTFPTWKGEKTPGILLDECYVDGKAGSNYALQIQGGPVKDTAAAAAAMKSHWESLGYQVGNQFTDPGVNQIIELNAKSPSGARVLFAPSKGGSFINVKSECSLDPAMKG